MTQENDAIASYLNASGVEHLVTFTSGGQHVAGSYHYQPGTCSPSGPIGLASDIGLVKGQCDSPALDAIFDAFVPVEHLLAELIYAHRPYNVKNGKRVPIYDFADNTHNHIHVAVFKGTFLASPKPAPKPAPVAPITKEQAMSRFPNAVDACLAPGGGVWVLGSDGGVASFGGAQFHGSMGGKPLAAPMSAIVAHGPGGYWLIGEDNGIFAFGDAAPIAPYQAMFDQFHRGDRAIMGAEWNGTQLVLIADDGATYGFVHT